MDSVGDVIDAARSERGGDLKLPMTGAHAWMEVMKTGLTPRQDCAALIGFGVWMMDSSKRE